MATVTANVRPAFREKRHNSRTEGRYHTGITRTQTNVHSRRSYLGNSTTTTTSSNTPVSTPTTSTDHCEKRANVHDNKLFVRSFTHLLGHRIRLFVRHRLENECNEVEYDGILQTLNAKDVSRISAYNIEISKSDVCERHPDGAHRKVNGQSEEAAEARFQEMVPWEDDSVPTVSFLTDDINSSGGWHPDEMFQANKEMGIGTSYRDNLEGYTTPMPHFASEEERMQKEREAEEYVRLIESDSGHRKRMQVENNQDLSEESLFASCLPVDPSHSHAPPVSNQRHSLTSRRPLSNQQAECSSHVRNSIPAQSTSMANSPHGFSHQRDRQQRDRFTNESRGRDWNTPGRGPSKKSVSSGGQPYSLSGTQIASSSALAHVQDIERVSLSGSERRTEMMMPAHHGGPMARCYSQCPSAGSQHPGSQTHYCLSQSMPCGTTHGLSSRCHSQPVNSHQGPPPQHIGPPPPHIVQPVTVSGPQSASPQSAYHRHMHSVGNHQTVTSHMAGTPPPLSFNQQTCLSMETQLPPFGPTHSAVQAAGQCGSAGRDRTDSRHARNHVPAIGCHGTADGKPPLSEKEKAVSGLKNFHSNFKLDDPADSKTDRTGHRDSGKRGHGDCKGSGAQKTVPASANQRTPTYPRSPPQHHPPVTMTSSQQEPVTTTSHGVATSPVVTKTTHSLPPNESHVTGVAPQQQSVVVSCSVASSSTMDAKPAQPDSHGASSQATESVVSEAVVSPSPKMTSSLNPLAAEFKPKVTQSKSSGNTEPNVTPDPVLASPQTVIQPAPGMGHQSHPTFLPLQNHQIVVATKMMPPQQNQQPRQHPKRAVVSVDPVAMAAQSVTGQPLQLAAHQAAAMQTTRFLTYLPGQVLPQPGQFPMQMRMLTNMDHGQPGPSQMSHIPQPFFMASQQLMPGHMAQAFAPTMHQPSPVPPNGQQHHHHLFQHYALPPSCSQNQPPTLLSMSPVQNHGAHSSHPSGASGHPAAAAMQVNSVQVMPQTPGTPQPHVAFAAHQITGMIPPQGHVPNAMPTHSVAHSGSTPTIHFMPANIGPAGISQGPLPAHVAHSAHINQSQHVILMPQHPPAVINQAPPTNHHQHGMVAAPHFQQHMHMGGHSYAAPQMPGVGSNQLLAAAAANVPPHAAGLIQNGHNLHHPAAFMQGITTTLAGHPALHNHPHHFQYPQFQNQ